MAGLITLEGVRFFFDPTSVTAVADRDADTGEAVTTVYGLTAARLRLQEGPEIFLNRIGVIAGFKKLTRVNDTFIWFNCKSVKVIRVPLAGEYPASANTVIPIDSALIQAVKERPEDVVRIINSGGGSL